MATYQCSDIVNLFRFINLEVNINLFFQKTIIFIFVVNIIFIPGYSYGEDRDYFSPEVTSDQLAVFKQLFSQADKFELTENEGIFYYRAKTDSELLGYIFLGCEKGFVNEIITYTGIDVSGICQGLIIFRQQETPRYFNLIIENNFADKFLEVDIDKIDIESRSLDEYEIDVITGATSSSAAIIENFWEAVEQFISIP